MQTIVQYSVYALAIALIISGHYQFISYLVEARRRKEENEKICTPFNSTINEYESKKENHV
tara:strand:+ start:7158 stop:7340 length:183 start_codon:yes stop_codon:yes gene_type:complete